MRYVDWTRTSADWVCPKSRYWGYEYRGIGLSGIEPQPELAFGLSMARGVEALRRGDLLPNSRTDDASILQTGLLLAYAAHIWPNWLAEFEVVGTEVECTIPLSSEITYMARPDAILKRKADDTIWVLSDKTTSQDPQNFTKQWDKAVQNHAECLAVERTLGLCVSGFYTQGWYKGYKSKGTIYSPLCYAWVKPGQPGLVADRWSEKYVYGWERRRIDQFPGGIVAWINRLSKDLVTQQFPVAGLIMARRDVVETYLQQVTDRECQLVKGTEGRDLARHFPQHFSHCDEYSKFRRPCEFRECCWAPTVGRDPIGSGLFKWREPHHKLEQESYATRTKG